MPWEKLETAAFSPRLLQIGWPPGPIWKEFLLKLPPKGHSPQPSKVGGTGVLAMSVWAHCWTLFLNAFLECFFRCSFWGFGLYFWGSGLQFGPLWEFFFAVFSYLGSFLKIALPCRRELKNQGPGVTEIAYKSNNKYFQWWDCAGKPVLKEIMSFLWKNASKTEPKLEPKSDLGGTWTTYFHPWVNMVAQVVPNGAQSGSKGAQRLPKWS